MVFNINCHTRVRHVKLQSLSSVCKSRLDENSRKKDVCATG